MSKTEGWKGPDPAGQDFKDAVARLIDRRRRVSQSGGGAASGAEACAEFVLPMLGALGWDGESMRGAARGPPGCELLAGGVPRVIVEARAHSGRPDGPGAARGKTGAQAERAIQRAWNRGVDWVVLAGFGEIRLYHALARTPEEGLVFSMPVDDMPRRLDDLSLLSRESVESGRLEALSLRGGRRAVDRQVVDDLDATRREMHDDMLRNGAGADAGGGLRPMVQTLMDRLLVMRIAEDRGLLEAGALRGEMERWRRAGQGTPFAGLLRKRLGGLEWACGAAPFRPGPVDGVALSGGALARAVDRLYGYDFSLIGSDVLGGMYEGYLAASQSGGGEGGGGGGAERKRLGIYYTPAHLVSHILDETLGRRLKACRTPEDVSRVRVLDPSCGSGSFLIKAFDMILEWYREYNRGAGGRTAAGSEAAEAAAKGLAGGGGYPGAGPEAVADPERRILRDNLFGIDVDPQAAGIAEVNLMLKAAGGSKVPGRMPGANILVGNSLVTGSEESCGRLGPGDLAALRPLDALRLPRGRFDVVVGNPPYYTVRGGDPIRVSEAFEAVRSGGPVNAAMMFVKRSIDLLGDGGRLGLVVPKLCSYAKGWSATRDLLLGQAMLTEVVDCMEAFRGVSLEQIIIVCEKARGGAGGGGAYRVGRAGPGAVRMGGAIGRSASREDGMIHVESDPVSWSIAGKMRSRGSRLGDMLRGDGCAITTGEYMQGLDCWLRERPEGGLRVLAGGDIARYRIAASRYCRRGERPAASGGAKAEAALAPHVVGQRIVAHIGNPAPHIALAFAYDEGGSLAFDTVTRVMPGKKIDPHALAAVLNSRAVSWYAHRFVFCNAVRSMDLRPWYMGRIVVPRLDAGAEKTLAGLGRRMGALAASRDAKRPRLRDYLAGRAEGALRLRDYAGAAPGGYCRVHDGSTAGVATRIDVVDEGGGWLGFFAGYHPPRTRILRRKKILSLRVSDRGIRDYIRAETGGSRAPARPARAAPLYEQIADARIGAYGRGVAENERRLKGMLGPYARDAARHEAWRARFAAADAEIDRAVCRAFGLSAGEARRIDGASRPPERSNC